MTESCLEAALAYSKAGLAVFPVRGKLPATEHGFKDATTDVGTVRRWWVTNPDAGIAAPLGPGVGIVLDVDPRHGGGESLALLTEEFGPLPTGPVVRTGGEGSHHWFAWPGGRVPTTHGFRSGLDLQSEGSYVVLPPSRHSSGRTYEWVRPLFVAALPMPPAWLLAVAGERTPGRTFELGADSRIPHGRRHDFIVSLAASIVSRTPGITESQALAIVRTTVHQLMDTDARTDADVAAAVRSALLKYGKEATPEPRPLVDPELAKRILQRGRRR